MDVEGLLRNILQKQDAIIKAQEAMAKDRESIMKDVNFMMDKVDELMDVSAERDRNHVGKLDTIMDSVVSKFKKTEEFPIISNEQLATLNDRILHGTEKFKTGLVNIKCYNNLIDLIAMLFV